MKTKILRLASVAALGAIGLAACDAAPPPDPADPQPVESEAITAGKTLNDVVRGTLAEIIRDEDAYSRARMLGTLLPTLGPDNVPAVKQSLEDLTVVLGATELDLMLRYWASHQPEEAARWAKEESPRIFRPTAVYTTVLVWAEADPQAAVSTTWEWAEETAELERIVPIATVRGWYAANDPPELRQYISELPIGILRQRAIAAYIRVVIETQGSDAVRHWAESLPDDDKVYKLAVFRRVVDALSQLDIEAGLRWCDDHCLGPYGNNMRSLIARTWVRRDGPAAMAWLSTAPDGYDRDLAVRLTFALWSRTDREAAMSWMASQQAGEPMAWLRPTYPVYARLLAEAAPTEAIQVAERIEDDRTRESVLIRVVRVWRHSDETAAEAWLLQSPLSEEAREKVRAAAKERPGPNG